MNLFFTNSNPTVCAEEHCDVHLVKMTLETAQLLCTAHRAIDGDGAPAGLYKATHAAHPCAVWVRATAGNYLWAFDLFRALLAEYEVRYGKTHACTRLAELLRLPPAGIEWLPRTEPPQCMPEEFRGDVVTEAYQRYIRGGKPFARWARGRAAPEWVTAKELSVHNA